MKIPRRRKRSTAKIEIIPMIDVMFFLLATIMMASIAMQKLNGVPVDLTSGQAEKILPNKDSITISITHDNLIFINQKPTELGEIKSLLGTLINDKNNNIFIASDENSKQGIVMKVALEAKKAGAQKFSFITKE